MTTQLLGPFTQVVTLAGLPAAGPISDDSLQIIRDGGIQVEDGVITAVGTFSDMRTAGDNVIEPASPAVVVPGLVDAHTHLCFAGSRAADYAKRLRGMSYQQIAAEGGGILDTVRKTRAASTEELIKGLLARLANNGSKG